METQNIFQRVIKLSYALSKIEASSKFCKNVTIFLLLDIHLLISFFQQDFTWLAAFGGLLTTLALLLIFSQNSLQDHEGDYNNLHLDKEPEHLTEGGMPLAERVPSDQKAIVLAQRKTRYNQKYLNINYYFWCTVVGTLTWSYAGFLNKLWVS